jgi:two-component system OmpR family sensor kinase
MKKTAEHAGTNASSDDGGRFLEEIDLEFLIHELKDPVSVVETGVRTLLERTDKYGPLTERQSKTLSRVLRNTQKLRDMVYDLLEIGRSEAGYCVLNEFAPLPVLFRTVIDVLELTVGGISDVLRRTTNETQMAQHLSAYGVYLDIAAECRSQSLHQDEVKFRQILGNLLKNAIHYRRQRVDIRAVIRDAQFVIAVSDDGPGIPAEHQAAVFTRYVRMGAGARSGVRGHGIGLAGSLALSRCLGGTIELDSRKNAGTTFTLTLPLRHTLGDP